ncbi:PepSY-like domain-containing protein [Chryseobacterium paridis]|uniref:PepSY-like domain-containing protein n=1 Tax=Chryseobacterium paridis TaxID=2800328 RepID=A0ABS1FVS1_9FLAO|nr:PepSY-like domain-containing protein [Chryseobacterium paridis]MBK1896541.1 PepSY-like domain-containing protein [Chryseobacterium paridis]
MKKLAVLVIMISGAAMVHAQKIQQGKVPVSVQTTFKNQFPEAKKVKWEMEKDNFEAEFQSKGTAYSVLFSASGDIIETEVPIKINTLSTPIRQFIAKNYPDQKIKEAAKITDSKGVMTYEAEVDGKDLIFDMNGNFIKEIKD